MAASDDLAPRTSGRADTRFNGTFLTRIPSDPVVCAWP